MLVISSVQSRSQLGGGRGKLHELPNQGALCAGVAAFSHTLMSASELPGVLARAFALFQAGRPRPVHIEIPLDVLVEEADDLLEPAGQYRPRRCFAERRRARLTAGWRQAPLILAGGGAIDAASELTELAELLDAPVA
jgi:acetolactate synthase-1/2/3 large subunit